MFDRRFNLALYISLVFPLYTPKAFSPLLGRLMGMYVQLPLQLVTHRNLSLLLFPIIYNTVNIRTDQNPAPLK